ncbi:MAG: type VI secretion system-associated FHA domain protein [Nannocystaceae bacterium]|nr:FHA domain-containing protein [bacterium]
MRPVRITVRSTTTGEQTDYQFTNSPVRIGRNRLNDLALPYAFVSGWHAVIRFNDTKATFYDLGSTNGSLHNGQRVQVGESVPIRPEAVVVLGDLELIMSHGQPAPMHASSGGTAPGSQPYPSSGGTFPGAEPQQSASGWIQAPHTGESAASGVIDPDAAMDPGGAPALNAHQTAHVPMRQIHSALAALRPYHEACRDTRLQFEQELRSQLAALPNYTREQAEDFIRREFNRSAPLEGSGAGPAATQFSGGYGSVTEFAEQLLPEVPPPTSELEMQQFLTRVRDVLEICAKGLVELQRGQEQFGREMGVKAIKEFTPLHVAQTSAEMLGHLLDFRHSGPERASQLAGLFADTMIHQVALLNGVAEGGRALLARLDPDEIERDVTGWGNQASKKWERFVALYRSVVGDDRVMTEMLFGPEFAQAYAQVGGEQSALPPDQDGNQDPHA